MNKYDLFLRKELDNKIENSYTEKIKSVLNINTIDTWKLSDTINNYEYKYESWYLYYRFKVLRSWFISVASDNDFELQSNLEKYLRNLNLNDFLNAQEKNYINDLKFINFTRVRNIKSLIIDFDTKQKEKSYFHYRNIKCSIKNKWEFDNIDLYLTNIRLVIISNANVISIYYDNIQDIKATDDNIRINYFNNSIKFRTNLSRIIEASLKRTFKDNKVKYEW